MAEDATTRLALELREVAALLRAGLPFDQAWVPLLGDHREANATLTQWAARQPAVAADGAAAIVSAAQVCRRTGAAPAQIMDLVADVLTDDADARAARTSALAGPRSTIRVLCVLPAAGLAIGSMLGAQPIRIILGGGMGTVAAILGVALMLAGWWWSRHLTAMATRTGQLAHTLLPALIAAVLETGCSLPQTLSSMSAGWDDLGAGLAVAGRCLGSGTGWEEAWTQARRRAGPAHASVVDQLIEALEPAWRFGLSAAPLLRARSTATRHAARRQSEVRAAQLGVRLMLPLGLCFLPAFMLVGLVPTVMSLASGLLAAA